MINFPSSTFTWKSHPWKPDPYYKWAGGFVGMPGEVYQVRFNLEAACEITDEKSGVVTELFVGAPCRTEYTIAKRNLFQVPSNEFRFAFSRSVRLHIAALPSWEAEPIASTPLSEAFQAYRIDVRHFSDVTPVTDGRSVVVATLANDRLNARSTYRDAERGLSVTIEYPVNLINVNEADDEFQVCTGPVIVPDLSTWKDGEVSRVFLAHVAITAFDHLEFILQRTVEAAESERVWLDAPRGRDRLELRDPASPPPGYPPPRPRPTVYNETWALPATNVVLRTPNG